MRRRRSLSILPDPYATNLAFDPRRAIDTGVIGTMTVTTRWQAGMVPTIDVLLPEGALSSIVTAPPSAAAATPSPASEVSNALDQDGLALAQLQGLFDQTVPGGSAGPTLLDLSTNVSQFGVSFGTSAPAEGPAPGGFEIAVADLFLQAPGFDVRVVTLPAVQWEPVLTPDQTTPFPSPLTYASSGSPTTLAVNSVTLVPIAPRPAIDALLVAYHATPPSAVAARFTLPFGIVAVAELHRSRIITLPSPSISQVQPRFSASNLKGGDQISIRAGQALVVQAGPPSLPGAAWQLHNARDSGGPTNTTVLTPIDEPFNLNFGPATATPRVPVTRIDISGFGCSMNAISPRSLLPNFLASGWSSARTRYWPRSGRASARICCRPPKWHWPSWPRALWPSASSAPR
jgi:hypothetical protein